MAENEEHSPAEGEKPKKSNLALIIVAVVLVLVLIIGGVIAFFMLSSHDEHGEANATATEHAAEEGHDKEAKAEGGHGEEGGSKEHKKEGGDSVEVGPMFPLTVFIVNLMSDTGGKYLKTTVSLELSDPKLTHEVESKKDRIRDYILGILSSKTVEEISTAKGKEDLKGEITDKINGNLKDGEIKNVYFTDFVIQ